MKKSILYTQNHELLKKLLLKTESKGNRFTYLMSFVLLMSLGSCATYSSTSSLPSAAPSGSRKIILEGDSISEESFGEFTSWYCKDYTYGGQLLSWENSLRILSNYL